MYACAYTTFDFYCIAIWMAVAASVLVIVCACTHPLLLHASTIDKQSGLKCNGIDFHRSIPSNPTVMDLWFADVSKADVALELWNISGNIFAVDLE